MPCTQYPCECCPFVKTFSYICRVTRFCRLTLHIVKVFFRKSLNENVVVFNAKGRYGTTLTSCRFVRIGAFCALIPHIYYGVGYCVVLFQIGSYHNLQSDKRKSAPHFLFVYTPQKYLELGFSCHFYGYRYCKYYFLNYYRNCRYYYIYCVWICSGKTPSKRRTA